MLKFALSYATSAVSLVALFLAIFAGWSPSFAYAFSRPPTGPIVSHQSRSLHEYSSSSSALYLNIGGWFGRKKRQGENDAENLGGVASIVDSMGDLKTAQRVGQLTDSLVKELTTTVVEGFAMDGKVKVSFDCQQKPVGVAIDEGLLSGDVDSATLSSALTLAMQDAHSKSIERMDEKMKNLYAELGLSATSA